MKAVLLSGGLGTRLRPLTDTLPKTMVKIGDKPVLWYHVQNLKRHGIKDIWVALHYLPEVVQNYFGDGSDFGVTIKYSVEAYPLGTAGALRNPHSKIEDDLKKDYFLVIYGDNLTDYDLSKLIRLHKKNQATVTIGLYESKEPWTMGVVETYKNGKVKRFVEKPPKEEVTTNSVSAGIVVCQPEILKSIPDGFFDFGRDLFPSLLSLNVNIYAFSIPSYVQDTGTLKRLTKARNDYKQNKINL